MFKAATIILVRTTALSLESDDLALFSKGTLLLPRGESDAFQYCSQYLRTKYPHHPFRYRHRS